MRLFTLWRAVGLATVALPFALVVLVPGQTGDNKMEEINFYRFGRATALKPELRLIHPAQTAAIPPAHPDGLGFCCPWSNQQRNSRSPYPLPAGEWRLRWRSELDPQVGPAYLLQGDNRILVRGREWRLLDMLGKVLFVGARAGGTLVLDPPKGRFYRITSNGELAANSLNDGKTVFLHLPSRGDVFSRTLIDRRRDRILIGGTERQLAPLDRGPQSHTETLLEIIDVPDPIQTTELKSLKSGTVSGMLQLPTAETMFAAAGDTIVAATPGRIYVIDWDLGIRHVLKGDFLPVLMSLDEAARIYLIVKMENTWGFRLITAAGESIFAFDAPLGIPQPAIPPMIAYDHATYIICGQQILAFGSDGKLNWNRAASKAIAGAFVVPDGRLIVTEGDSIVAWTPQGERLVLFTAGGEQFRTPPILTSSGELLAASTNHLYCLSVAKGISAPRP